MVWRRLLLLVLLQLGGSKIQGGSSPTMISEWGVTPIHPSNWGIQFGQIGIYCWMLIRPSSLPLGVCNWCNIGNEREPETLYIRPCLNFNLDICLGSVSPPSPIVCKQQNAPNFRNGILALLKDLRRERRKNWRQLFIQSGIHSNFA